MKEKEEENAIFRLVNIYFPESSFSKMFMICVAGLARTSFLLRYSIDAIGLVPYCTIVIYMIFPNLTTSRNRLFSSSLLQSLFKQTKSGLGDMQPVSQHNTHGQHTQRTGLMGCGEGNRNHVDESADTQGNL